MKVRSFTGASCCRRVRDTRRGYGAPCMNLEEHVVETDDALALGSRMRISACSALPGLVGALTTSNSASQLLKTAIASATQHGSVHVTVHFFSGNRTGEVVEDSALQSGVETVAIGQERVRSSSLTEWPTSPATVRASSRTWVCRHRWPLPWPVSGSPSRQPTAASHRSFRG
jgi:hypothetical protein